MELKDWIRTKITSDSRALAWFEEEECEPRIVKAYRELLSGYESDPSKILKITRMLEKNERPSLVTIDEINFYSMCAHHFLPFYGTMTITYLPGDRILGLGKFPRLAQAYARRFQIQEDLVKEVAEEIMSSGHARAVRVSATARHMCMCSRGPGDNTVMTETEYARGDFNPDAPYRS